MNQFHADLADSADCPTHMCIDSSSAGLSSRSFPSIGPEPATFPAPSRSSGTAHAPCRSRHRAPDLHSAGCPGRHSCYLPSPYSRLPKAVTDTSPPPTRYILYAHAPSRGYPGGRSWSRPRRETRTAGYPNGACANYNGLLLNLTTRDFHGLTTTAAYTFSKSMNNATDGFRSTGSAGGSIAYAQNPLNTSQGERGAKRERLPQRGRYFLRLQIPQTCSRGLSCEAHQRIRSLWPLLLYRFNFGRCIRPTSR
jgi:hypothetical protein